MDADFPLMPCEGAGGPNYGYCQMCGRVIVGGYRRVPQHERVDILAVVEQEG